MKNEYQLIIIGGGPAGRQSLPPATVPLPLSMSKSSSTNENEWELSKTLPIFIPEFTFTSPDGEV